MPKVVDANNFKFSVEESTKDLPLLGYLVMWNLRNVEIHSSTLKQKLAEFGFTGMTIKPIGKHTALRRALMKWAQNKKLEATGRYEPDSDDWLGDETDIFSGIGEKKKALVRKIKTNEDNSIVMAVVIENIDTENIQLGYGTELRVSYNKKEKTVSVTTTAAGEFEKDDDETTVTALSKARDEIRALFAFYQETYLSLDLGDLIRNIIMAQNAFNVRALGGVYFVPKASAGEREKLENLRKLVMENFGTMNQSEVTILPQPDIASSRKQLANAAFTSTLNEINSMQEELKLLEDNAKNGDHAVRSWNIGRKLTAYRKVLQKAAIYKDVLGMQQERIIQLTTGLQDKAKVVLKALEAAEVEGDTDEDEDEPGEAAPAPEAALEEAVEEYTPAQQAKDTDDLFGDLF